MQKVTMDIKNDKPKRFMFERFGTFLFGERLVIMHACICMVPIVPVLNLP